MKWEDLMILILALLLLASMLFTLFFGGEKSLHGVGSLYDILSMHLDINCYSVG